MTDEHPDETSRDTVDRAIAGLLAVDPSPEFVAKVRERVAAQPEPGMWRFGWVAAGAAAVAVLVLAVVVSRPPAPLGDADERVLTVARADDIELSAGSTPTVVPNDGVTNAAPLASEVAPTDTPDGAVPDVPLSEPNDSAVTPLPTPRPLDPATSPAAPLRLARVVISDKESAALRRLFTLVNNRRLEVPRAQEPFGSIAAVEPPADVIIPPVTIEPVTLALTEGAVQ